MSLKGTNKPADERAQRNDLFAPASEEESKTPFQAAKPSQTPAKKVGEGAAGNETTPKGDGDTSRVSASKEPILGLESNTNNQSKVPLKTIDQLLIHNSDTAVKPIIGNKDIERHGTLEFTPSSLPFEPWTAEQVAQQIES